MARSKTIETVSPINKFVFPDHPNRTLEKLIDPMHLRNKIKEATGEDMASLNEPLSVIGGYFDSKKTVADLSLASMSAVLPEKLVQALKTMKPRERFLARELYHEMNELVSENHVIAFNLLREQAEKDDIGEFKTNDRKDVVNAVFKKINAGESISDELKTALSTYSEYSWYLVFINHKGVYDRAYSVSSKLTQIGLDIPPEDIFQDSLQLAYENALNHDPKKGKFTNLLYNRNFTSTLLGSTFKREGLPSDLIYSYLTPYAKASSKLRGTIYEGDRHAHELLTALYHFRNISSKGKKQVEFADEDALLALTEFIDMVDNPVQGGYKDSTKSELKVNIKQAKIVNNFTQRLSNVLGLINADSIDEERLITFEDAVGQTSSFMGDAHDRLTHEADDLRPVETIVENRGFGDTVIDTLDKIGSVEKRDKEIFMRRFGLDGKGGATLRELAEEYHISRQRVRVIENRILRHLRHPSRSHLIRPYLNS